MLTFNRHKALLRYALSFLLANLDDEQCEHIREQEDLENLSDEQIELILEKLEKSLNKE